MVIKNGDLPHIRYYIPSVLLDDLCSRFVLNLPPEERWDAIRFCFHIEMAHWFYLDNYCATYNLRPCDIKKFAAHIFKHISYPEHLKNLDSLFENWKNYKQSIPTYGAILLDEDLSHVLLVQPFNAKTFYWGFPKGKINEDEEPWTCAAREVLEETGFDISKQLNKMEYIDTTINNKNIRLYIIPDVPHDTNFKPHTQNEIRICQWFGIDNLPSNKKEMTLIVNKGEGYNHNSFKMVMPFIKIIRRWVSERNLNESTSVSRQHSVSYDEFFTTMTEIGISHELQNAVTNYHENFSTQDLQDAFRKYQQKNYPTLEPQSDFMQYQHQDFSSQELQIAYMKYLKHNQRREKLLNMGTKNEQQHLSYYKYQDRQLHPIPNAPMTPNKANTSENNLSNLEKYYQQDLLTQQLKNALMICEQQNSPWFAQQESQLYQKRKSSNNSYGWSNNTSENNLSNLEEYYQQDLSTEQLENVLMMYEQQNFPCFEQQESQLYQKRSSPNNSYGWSKNTSENNLSNLEEYYQQDISTEQLENVLMMYEQQNSPCFQHRESQLYQKRSSPINSYGWSKNTSENNLSNLEEYYQQDISTEQLENVLMMYEQHNSPCFQHRESQLYQKRSSPINSYGCSKNTSENNLSNLEEYYQQDLLTQQLKNALMISEQQNLPCFEYEESQLNQKRSSPNNSHGWSKNTSENNLSNLEEYYLQDLSTEQLENVLMMYEQQNFPYFEQ